MIDIDSMTSLPDREAAVGGGVCLNGQPVLFFEFYATIQPTNQFVEFVQHSHFHFHSEVIEFWLVGWIVGLNV